MKKNTFSGDAKVSKKPVKAIGVSQKSLQAITAEKQEYLSRLLEASSSAEQLNNNPFKSL